MKILLKSDVRQQLAGRSDLSDVVSPLDTKLETRNSKLKLPMAEADGLCLIDLGPWTLDFKDYKKTSDNKLQGDPSCQTSFAL
jgi:hypothetical protein